MKMVYLPIGKIIDVPNTVGDGVFGLDTDVEAAIAHGFRFPPVVADGYVRVTAAFVDGTDGRTAAPAVPDITQAAYDAQTASLSSAQYAAQTAKAAAIQSLRDAYAATTGQLCAMAGIDPVRIMTLAQVEQYVQPLIAGANGVLAVALSLELSNLETKLIALDGADALNRV
jgi:hypothetical protein